MARVAKSSRAEVSRRGDGASRAQSARAGEILEAAAALFAELGYGPATMDELADRTKLNKGTIYYYFKSKADILFELVCQALDRSLFLIKKAQEHADAVDAIEAMVEHAVAFALEDPAKSRILLKEQEYFPLILAEHQVAEVRRRQREYMSVLYGMLSEGTRQGVFRTTDVVVTGRVVVSILSSLATWGEVPGGRKAVAAGLKALLLDGVRAPK